MTNTQHTTGNRKEAVGNGKQAAHKDRNTLPISKIFCDRCKKAFPSQTSITKNGICRYMVNGTITGYSFQSTRPIKKVSMVSGYPVEKETYTRKFVCKNCY